MTYPATPHSERMIESCVVVDDVISQLLAVPAWESALPWMAALSLRLEDEERWSTERLEAGDSSEVLSRYWSLVAALRSALDTHRVSFERLEATEGTLQAFAGAYGRLRDFGLKLIVTA